MSDMSDWQAAVWSQFFNLSISNMVSVMPSLFLTNSVNDAEWAFSAASFIASWDD